MNGLMRCMLFVTTDNILLVPWMEDYNNLRR